MNHHVQLISVVDDSAIIRRAFRAMLEHAGYCVTVFASGKEFLDRGLQKPADCILLDLEMPEPNGIEVLRKLQDLACTTPVVVVTGTDKTALLADADCDIVVNILEKPIGPDVLLAAVDEALRSSSHDG